ncbi:MAG: GNAT family N-acetyltransferase [Labilithrix sp.]|nr:GNAT family N-acetyltransferase [Labilithrix sp.]MCW5814763.1 GNAT family N-acetyltransferase [Labilithrix sp.]
MAARVRPGTANDVPVVLALIRELAEYEREPDAAVATAEDLLRDGFGDEPAFHVLIAEDGGEPIGFALYFFSYSTWRGRRCLYLEDLFVRPAHRGRGAGVALMRALARAAVAAECPRFVWQVLDWNQPAIDFYEKLGAKVTREWLTVRLEGDALAALARD